MMVIYYAIAGKRVIIILYCSNVYKIFIVNIIVKIICLGAFGRLHVLQDVLNWPTNCYDMLLSQATSYALELVSLKLNSDLQKNFTFA